GRRCLYVSDSHDFKRPGPGIWRYDLDTGEGGLWYDQPLTFANGMALVERGAALLAIETFARRIARIEITADGRPGTRSDFAVDLPGLPDGLALDDTGNIYVALLRALTTAAHRSAGSGCRLYRGPHGPPSLPSDQHRLRWPGALRGQSRAVAHHARRHGHD